MTWSSFWAILFFLMLVCVGMGSQMGHLLVMTTALYDQFPRLGNKFENIFVVEIALTLEVSLSCMMQFFEKFYSI
jgi:hypothetical protein